MSSVNLKPCEVDTLLIGAVNGIVKYYYCTEIFTAFFFPVELSGILMTSFFNN